MSKLKKKIKQSFWGNYLISCYHCVMCKVMPNLVSDEKAVEKLYKKAFGKELDLDNPKTFAEKTNWFKLNDRNPLMEKCADKVAVRDYVTEKGYGDCLNELYGVYDRVEDIDLDKLPDQFVIKAAHGSHMNYIVKDKSSFDWKHAKKMMKTWLHQDIYWSGREWVYKDIPKRLLAEKYLEDQSGELKDFKFFCFHGKPTFLQFNTGRYGKTHYCNFYDMNKHMLPIQGKGQLPNLKDIPFPLDNTVFERMKKICIDLSEPFQQVRVDLYTISEKVLFGELTFFDDAGTSIFYPDEWNVLFSEEWKIITN